MDQMVNNLQTQMTTGLQAAVEKIQGLQQQLLTANAKNKELEQELKGMKACSVAEN